MLTIEIIEKAIALHESGASESAVSQATGIRAEEAKAVADALHVGKTDRLFSEIVLAGVLEAAAQALRSGRGLIGDDAGDVVREIWHSYPNAGLNVDNTNQAFSPASGVDRPGTEKDKSQ